MRNCYVKYYCISRLKSMMLVIKKTPNEMRIMGNIGMILNKSQFLIQNVCLSDHI